MIVMSGASGGLGGYLIERLGKDQQIIGTYNNHKPESSDPQVPLYQVNVCDSASVERFVDQVGQSLQRLTLINLAGISLDGMGHKMGEAIWDSVLDTNLKGAFLMSRALLPFMREQEWGRIINISSVVGQMGVPGTCAYSASKAGLAGLTRTLAVENATKNITVNTLALGYYKIGMIGAIDPSIQEQIRATIPMRRFGDPKDVEVGIRFLIECDYITGSVVNINGGLL